MNYDEHSIQDMRLRILQLLRGASGYDLNDVVISSSLKRYGHRPSAAVLRTELEWLAEQGCVTIETIEGDLQLVTLGERGMNAATGRTSIPGIRRPRPGE